MCEKPADLLLTIDPLKSTATFSCTRTERWKVELKEYNKFVLFLDHLKVEPGEQFIITFEKIEHKEGMYGG
jgi:hypothetical protein